MMGSANVLTGSDPHGCGRQGAHTRTHSLPSRRLSVSFLFPSVLLTLGDRDDNGAVCSPCH